MTTKPRDIPVIVSESDRSRPLYYYVKAWVESLQDIENVIVQSPDQEGVSGALLTFDLYLNQEYPDIAPLVSEKGYFIQEVTLLDLPIITRTEVQITQYIEGVLHEHPTLSTKANQNRGTSE